MSLFAAVFVGGMTAWFINYVEDKQTEKQLKQMYQDKYGSEWDDKIYPQGVVQNALGYGESPTLYYNEAESEVVSGKKRGKVISMIGSDPRLRKLTKDKGITPEEAAKRLEISAEHMSQPEIYSWRPTKNDEAHVGVEFEDKKYAGRIGRQVFEVEFDDWAEQEMKTHGYNISFREWADEEGQSHGDEELLDWAQHEEESHDARYDAESLSFDYTPLAKCDICGGHEQVGYVDDNFTLKVCEHCDIDGADYDPKLWEAESYKPPASAVSNAKRGLSLRKEFGRGGLSPSEAKAQGIDSGVTRARKIASGKVSRHDVRRMSAFNRHRKNYRPEKKMPDGGPTAGTIAWLLWGGTSGVNWAKNKSASMNAESEIVVVPECLFCENDDTDEPLVEVMLDGYPELICESCMDPNNWAAESFGPVDEDGILAKALAKARAKSKEPRRPLKITKLPHRNQKSLKDFEEFNSAIVYRKPEGIVAQVMAKEKALQQLALSEALLELEQYIRLGMITEEEAFRKIVQMSQ